MLRWMLALMLLSPCPGCWMQRLAFESTPLVAPVAESCDCCPHEQTPEPGSPCSKPECACKVPAIAAQKVEPQAAPAAVATLSPSTVTPVASPSGFYIGGYTALGYSTGPTRTSPLRQ